MSELRDQDFAFLQQHLRSSCGIDVTADKRYLFETRLLELARENGGSFAALCEALQAGAPTVQRRLIELMTTGETGFFRDGHPFVALRQKILPALAARRVAEALSLRPRLRLLCVGCASGEEAYSVSVCLHAWLATQRHFEARDVGVLAVDVSAEALRRARQALYDAARLDSVPAEYRGYFGRRGDKVTPLPAVQSTVVFGEVNLVEPLTHLGCFDVILCRNVLIYFALPLRMRVVEQLSSMLRPGGVLLLGASESLYRVSDALRVVQSGATTYYSKES